MMGKYELALASLLCLIATIKGHIVTPPNVQTDISPETTTLTELQRLFNEIETLKEALGYQRTQRHLLESRVAMLEKRAPALTLDAISDVIAQALEQYTYNQIAYRQQQRVYFSAKLDRAILNMTSWDTVVFSSVETNIGEAYNSRTGKFTAPRAGWYAFFSTILSQADSIIETSLQVNGVNKMYLYSAGASGGLGSASNMVILYLAPGDVVKMVKHGPWGTPPFYIHSFWSTFSGFLLATESPMVHLKLKMA